MGNYVIETRKLTKKFGKQSVIEDLNLQVPQGCVYGFLGPNGAGKSTTIRMLLGLMKPTDGEVFIFGQSIKSQRLGILRKVGSLVEHPSYYGHLTAFENLDIKRRILEIEKMEVDRVLEMVGLLDVKNKKVKKFSMGMKQRLGIAHALLGNPRLLLLDEPLNGLDPAGIREIRDLIRSLPEKTGMTIFLSSHLLSEMDLVASHIGIINRGNLLFQGAMEELKSSHPQENLEDIFLSLTGNGVIR